MSRVITFSRSFPAYHPKAGEPTYFVEKLMAGFADVVPDYKIPDTFVDWDWYKYYNAMPKLHTVRAGDRWKVGDKFSPRIWSGKPYNSPQISIGPDIEIKKIYKFEIVNRVNCYDMLIDGEVIGYNTQMDLAQNDGLTADDFLHWFDESMTGQIICWTDKIKYP